MRDLPWRRSGPPGQRDPYHSLLSELMLQQTQVTRVIDKFNLFLQRFPTLAHLAAAPVEEVLALWSGLGYYRRARLLHAAAQTIVNDHDGIVPRDPATLRTIPGIGPYTAGAIASIAHGEPAPLVDGNVVRVLLRVDGRDGAADDKPTIDWTWKRAATLVQIADHPGALNEALMELGATVCVPRSPRCDSCPLADLCKARAQGRQDEIPTPKTKSSRRVITQTCVILRDTRGRVLMEERPATGLWAGLWQPLTIDAPKAKAAARRAIVGALESLGVHSYPADLDRAGVFTVLLSHREIAFHVWHCTTRLSAKAKAHAVPVPSTIVQRRWIAPKDLSTLAVSNAHAKALALVDVSFI